MVSLYEQVGGEKAVDAAVDVFYRKVLSDERVARFFVGVSRKDGARYTPELALVNGELGFVGRIEGRAALVLTVESDGERIHAVYVVSNPDKLARFA